MRFLALVIFAMALVAVSAKPSLGLWGGHGAIDPGAVVVGPSGTIAVGPSSAGAVIPGAGWGWGPHGYWGAPGIWAHNGLWW